MIYFGTGITENYLEKASTFLDGLNNNITNDIIKFVITLGWNAQEDVIKRFKNLKFVYQDIDTIKDELTSIKCLQHGAFVDVFDFAKEDDIIIFSDSDIVVQRDITPDELKIINTISKNDIASNNNSSSRTLSDELKELSSIISTDEVDSHFNIKCDELKIYCTGIVIATLAGWRKLRDNYVQHFEFINSNIGHYAKQQFLMSIFMQTSFNFIELPNSFHSHGCWGLPYYCKMKDGKLLADDEIVLLNHHFDHIF